MEERTENTQKQPVVSAYGAVLGETTSTSVKEDTISPKEETKPHSTYSTGTTQKKPSYGLYTNNRPVDDDPFADSPFTNPSYMAQQEAQKRMTREQYAERMKKERKNSRILQKLITFVITLIILLVVVPIVINQIEKLTCDRPLSKMEYMVNNRQTSSQSVIKAMTPYFLNTMYQDIYEICNNNVEYRNDLQKQESNFKEMMETLYSSMFASDDAAFSYEINSKTELSKEELQSIRKTYVAVAELVPNVQSLMEAMYGKTALSQEEISQISEIVEKMGTKMEKMKVFAGYKLNVTTKLDGKDQSTLDIVVVLANGRWMIEYISTAAISADKSYNIEKMYQSVSGTLVSQMKLTLNALTSQVSSSDKDFEEILEDVLESVSSQITY